MPLLWGKSSSKDAKCVTTKGRFIDLIRRKFNPRLREKKTDKSGGSPRYPSGSISEKGFNNFSLSAVPSMQLSRCNSFTEEPHAEPFPPSMLHSVVSSNRDRHRSSKPSLKFLLSEHGYDHNQPITPDGLGGLATASVSSDSSIDTNDQLDFQFLSPQKTDYVISNPTTTGNPSRDHVNLASGNHIPFTYAEKGQFGAQVTKLQTTHADYFTAPGSNISIPSRSLVTTSTQRPLHPLTKMFCTELSKERPDDGKSKSYKLPLPPMTSNNTPTNVGRPDILASHVSRWKKGLFLGSGTFGHVYQGFDSDTGELCAMKEVSMLCDDAKSKESAQQIKQVNNDLIIYLEYVPGGCIYNLLNKYGKFGEPAIRRYTRQILTGLAYLHSKNIVHRDIKGANILIDPNGHIKLADFGMAKHIIRQSSPLSFKGSPHWMAPEIINKSTGSSFAVDIWSLGCTIIEMATTKPPWSQYEGVAALFKIGNTNELPEIPDVLSDEGKDFVLRCLQRNPSNRPTAGQLLDHPFVGILALPERRCMNSDPIEPHYIAIDDAVRNRGNDQVKKMSNLYPDQVVAKLSSNPRTPKQQSCAVSPIGRPLLQSNSSQPMCRMMSPPIFRTPINCGSSTSTRDKVAFTVNHFDHSVLNSPEKMGGNII